MTARDDQWMQYAACRGMDTALFFPEPHDTTDAAATAKKICARCPARIACAKAAIERKETAGIYAGVTFEANQARNKGRIARLYPQLAEGITGRAEHGTEQRYRTGCRCAACKLAWHDHMRSYVTNRRNGSGTVIHGTRSAYLNDGCRCASCRAAEAVYRKQRTAREQAS